MQYNQFGRTGLVVSRMGFGAMTFGDYDFRGFKAKVGESEARKMIATALDSGINLFDTADMYSAGQSETLLGKALAGHRHEVVISTKVFFRSGPAVIQGGLSKRHILAECEASLKRLGTDYIDIYLLHNFDFIAPLEETARALEDLQRAGKVRYVGESNFLSWQAEKLLSIQKLNGFAPLSAIQVYYSLLGRDIEWEIVPQAREAGMGIMIWSPLAGGFLSGKYTKDNPTGDGHGRRASFDFPPIDLNRGYDIVDGLKRIAKTHGTTPTQIALAWILSRPWVNVVLVGATGRDQLEANLKADGIALGNGEITELDVLSAVNPPYPVWMQWGEQGAADAIKNGWKPGVVEK